MDGSECLKPVSMYVIVTMRFPVWYFFEWVNRVVVSSSSPNSFLMLLIYSAFLRSHILLPICFVSLSSGCWYVFVLSTPFARRIFCRLFGMSYFVCIILSSLDIFSVFLLLPVPFDLFPRVVLIFFLLVVLFSFFPYMFQRSFSVLSFSLRVVDFLSAFLVEFSIQILRVCSCSFGEHCFFTD